MTMKTYILLLSSLLLLNACGTQQGNAPKQESTADNMAAKNSTTGNAIPDTDLGLSKTSVFDTPEPQTISYSDKFPGTSTVFPRAYLNAPPQIPHNIENFKPITASNNACMGCHNNPSMRGKEITKGMPTPMPESHYTDLRHKPGVVREQIVEARYVCTQCHVPQANVDTLVENTFQNSVEP